MKAMILKQTASLSDNPDPLTLVDLPDPTPLNDELLVRVTVCGVCHTELDEIEGRLPPSRLPIVLGHQVIGRVADRGSLVTSFPPGSRVGIGWIHRSSGEADENLSAEFIGTGCDVDGGYAQYITVPAAYAVAIPESLGDAQAAPLMCAGAIGYRALRLTGIVDGQALGLMGFGGSAHLVLPLARHLYPQAKIFVFTRDRQVQRFAVQRGADWAGDIDAASPQPLHAMIDTTPVWRPVLESLRKLAPGGRLVINAIRKQDDDKAVLRELSYHEHLWMEREIKSVANLTHRDLTEFLPLAAQIPLQPEVTLYPLAEANEALRRLRQGSLSGSNVLQIDCVDGRTNPTG